MLNEITQIEALFELMEAETRLDLFYSPFLSFLFFVIFMSAFRKSSDFLKSKFRKYEKGIEAVTLFTIILLINVFVFKVVENIKTEGKVFKESIVNFEQNLSDKQRVIINTEIYLYLKENVNKDEDSLLKNLTVKEQLVGSWNRINQIIGNDPNKLSQLTDKIYFDYFLINKILRGSDDENSMLRERYTQYLNNDIREKVYK